MKKTRFLGLFVAIFFTYLIPLSFVNASEFNFSVEPTTPKTQIDPSKSYYDIKLAPNQEEILEAKLRNDTNKKVTIEIDVESATTNSNVIVEYSKNNSMKDSSLPYVIKDYVEYPSSVDLEPGTEKLIQLKVKMPNQPFDGVLANGITFKEKKDESETSSSSSNGLSIKNEYSYVLALLMRQNTNEVNPNLILHKVSASQINARNVILATIQNDQPTYINQVAIDAKVTKKNSNDVLYSENKNSLQVAPNSQFSFPISLNGQSLKSGTYHLSVTVYGNKNENGVYTKTIDDTEIKFANQWKFEKDFTIDGETAKKLNAKDVTIKKDPSWLYILIGIILLLILILFILWFIWKRRNDKEKNEDDQTTEESKGN